MYIYRFILYSNTYVICVYIYIVFMHVGDYSIVTKLGRLDSYSTSEGWTLVFVFLVEKSDDGVRRREREKRFPSPPRLQFSVTSFSRGWNNYREFLDERIAGFRKKRNETRRNGTRFRVASVHNSYESFEAFRGLKKKIFIYRVSLPKFFPKFFEFFISPREEIRITTTDERKRCHEEKEIIIKKRAWQRDNRYDYRRSVIDARDSRRDNSRKRACVCVCVLSRF